MPPVSARLSSSCRRPSAIWSRQPEGNLPFRSASFDGGDADARYDLVKRNRYVNKTFVQTSRGCHQGCTFCPEPLMNGLKFRYRPVDEVMYEVDHCGSRMI